MASFDMILSLHCDLAPRIILACPLGFQLLLTWVCYLPASTATSSMLWHLVEHTQCVHWTRPEHANCSHAPESTRWPHGFGPLCSTTPRAPLLAATRQAAPAAPGRPSASCRRRPTASAHVGAAKATSARQLAPGAVPTRPLAPAVIPSHATLPCKLQRGGSPESLSGRRGTDLDEL